MPLPETDPRRIDTDGDNLPDGWIDGWCFNKLTGAGAGINCPVDGVRQRYEGEDLNLNGIYDLGNNETNPAHRGHRWRRHAGLVRGRQPVSVSGSQ